MSNYVGNLVGKEIDKSMQMHMRDEIPNSSNIKADSKFAREIDNFLSGNSNRLPSFEFLSAIDNTMPGECAISVGFGYIISRVVDDEQPEVEPYIKVEREEPIDNANSRIDIITANSYSAYVYSRAHGVRDFDPTSNQVFSSKRIEFLQNYLQQYEEYKKEQSITTSKVR